MCQYDYHHGVMYTADDETKCLMQSYLILYLESAHFLGFHVISDFEIGLPTFGSDWVVFGRIRIGLVNP